MYRSTYRNVHDREPRDVNEHDNGNNGGDGDAEEVDDDG